MSLDFLLQAVLGSGIALALLRIFRVLGVKGRRAISFILLWERGVEGESLGIRCITDLASSETRSVPSVLLNEHDDEVGWDLTDELAVAVLNGEAIMATLQRSLELLDGR